jgi:hypothetical protein
MDQVTTATTIWGAVIGSSGVTGIAVQGLALWREKRGWRAEMEARQAKAETRLQVLEAESPRALIDRIDQMEEFRENDKRDLLQQLGRLRGALNVTLDAISKIQDRLGITAV